MELKYLMTKNHNKGLKKALNQKLLNQALSQKIWKIIRFLSTNFKRKKSLRLNRKKMSLNLIS